MQNMLIGIPNTNPPPGFGQNSLKDEIEEDSDSKEEMQNEQSSQHQQDEPNIS